LIALAAAGCGGGGGGDGGGGPAPPQEPTVFTTATAVRVTRATPFGANCTAVPTGATAYANAEVEPHLAIDPTNPNHLVAAWQQDRMSDGGARGLATAVSVDGGTTWSIPRASSFSQCGGGSFARTSDPWVAVNGSTVIQIGIAFSGGTLTAGARSGVLVSRSVDGGTTWGAAVPLADDDGAQFFNDKETLTIDATDPSHAYAIWDRLDTTDRGPTVFTRSTDGGLNWSPAAVIYDPGISRQTIGNVVVTTPDGVVHAFFTELGPVPGNPGATEGHLAVMRSTDKGATWSAPVQVADLLAVGTRVPNQPQLTVRAGEILAAFAADPLDGTLYAAWQDSRFSGGAHDGIAMAWSSDGGATWSTPTRVNADPTVPAFTPTLAVLPDGTVAVTYYDFRQSGTSTFQPTDFRLAVSSDRVTWRETRLAGNFDILDAPNAGGLFVGDYQGLVGVGSTAIALYSRTNNGNTSNRTDVFADRIDTRSITAVAATPGDASRKAVVPEWSDAAEARVSRHLAEVRASRLAQWHRWLESAPPHE
jgi:hypothetical protein